MSVYTTDHYILVHSTHHAASGLCLTPFPASRVNLTKIRRLFYVSYQPRPVSPQTEEEDGETTVSFKTWNVSNRNRTIKHKHILARVCCILEYVPYDEWCCVEIIPVTNVSFVTTNMHWWFYSLMFTSLILIRLIALIALFIRIWYKYIQPHSTINYNIMLCLIGCPMIGILVLWLGSPPLTYLPLLNQCYPIGQTSMP